MAEHHAKKISSVALSTLLSRVLGLVRDFLLFYNFGTSVLNSAFLLAFSLPNLFRRLLGEGALSSALIPVFSDELEKGGKPSVFKLLNNVITRVGLLMLGLVGIGFVVFYGVDLYGHFPERWTLASLLSVILFPYLILVCLAAILAACLNVLNRFTVAALSQVWLNLSMISGLLLLAWGWFSDDGTRILVVSLAVLAGGFLQVLVPMIALRRDQWRGQFIARKTPAFDHTMALFIPGIFGAAIIQINMICSRFLAFSIDESAVSILYLANRLIEFPLGIFAIAVITVVFPQLSRAISRKDDDAFQSEFSRASVLISAITVPAAVGLIVYAKPILATLFMWGAFSYQDVVAAKYPLIIFAAVIPFYARTTFLVKSFHAMQDMKTPVRAAGWNFCINIGASLVLMFPFGVVGIALANAIAIVVQSSLLARKLKHRMRVDGDDADLHSQLKILLSALGMGLVTYGLKWGVELSFPADRLRDLGILGLGIPLGIVVYFMGLKLMRVREYGTIKAIVLRR